MIQSFFVKSPPAHPAPSLSQEAFRLTEELAELGLADVVPRLKDPSDGTWMRLLWNLKTDPQFLVYRSCRILGSKPHSHRLE